MNALDLIHAVPEVEKRLADDISRKIYELRMDYAIYKEPDTLIEKLIDLESNWRFSKKFDDFMSLNKPENVIIFGAGAWGKHTLNILKRSKYKNLNFIFCDNDSKKWTENKSINSEEVNIINPNNAFNIEKSIIVIGNLKNRVDIQKQLIENGYSENRVVMPLYGYVGRQYFDYFGPKENEIFVDAGCFNGNTAVNFTKWATKGYEYIYSFEANAQAISKCKETFVKYNLKGELIASGLWNEKNELHFNNDTEIPGASRIKESGSEVIKTVALDDILNGRRVTFIKMDIEGAEYKALLGSKKTIKKWRSRLAICIYHKPEDILEIPALLIKMQPDYKFALRQYRSDACENVLYAY